MNGFAINRFVLLLSLAAIFTNDPVLSQPNEVHRRTGFTMRLKLDNKGALGHVAYPGAITPGISRDSVGLEYPIGSSIEHIYGAGMWLGARVDTSAIPGTSPRVKAVTTGYEGWSGPYHEFFPNSSRADTFWIGNRNNRTKPVGWDAYWGANFTFKPISDEDLYVQYADYYRRPTGHVPLGVKVIQSSYTWNDPYAKAIIIIEYKIINTTNRSLDSVFIGFFNDADVGPVRTSGFENNNFTGYYGGSRTAYIHNPLQRGSTPIGVSFLYPEDTSTVVGRTLYRYTFQWYPGNSSPNTDAAKYDLISSGIIRGDEYPSLSDTRFLFGFGPFNVGPAGQGRQDTLRIAIGLVSGDDLRDLQTNANRALNIYKNQGIQLPATPPSPPLRAEVGFRRVTLDWKWRPGDDVLFGPEFKDPEANWDTTSKIARWDPARFRSRPGFSVPPGIDSMRGGRNFEAYRIWRSENPDYPDESFTLIKQIDVIEDVDSARFEYETGIAYTFTDSNLVRGKTYVYAVTSKSIPNLVEQRIRTEEGRDTTVRVPVEPLESSKRINARRVDLPFAVSKTVNQVSVVPNPYRTDQDYKLETGGYEGLTSKWTENERRIKFINLPEKCTIRVFSLAGDLIRTIQHDGGGGSFPRGDTDMLLVSESNRALASGIYIFTVESAIGVQTGKFVIIR